jgi:2,4-dienoyl-CoA reductase-like NADH-dependent reductase (Old Yellow Enzyme family)/thioredoxin reductase
VQYDYLFSPGQIGTLSVKNRVVMTAMGTGLANKDGTVNEKMISFYEARAKGGTGLIITEVTSVNGVHGRHNPWQIGAYSDDQITGLSELARRMHKYDAKIFLQLYHPGNQTFCDLVGGTLMTPSGVESRLLKQASRAMTIEEIHTLVGEFADAAERAKKAGIDGVEIHAAHGYLLNEFLSPYTNKRTDEYGGDWKCRAKIIKDIITAIRERVGRDFPVILRMSVDEFLHMTDIGETGLTLEESLKIIPWLVSFGFDAVSVSSGTYDTQNIAWEPTSYQQGWRMYLAEAVKEVVDVPVIAVSVIREPGFANSIIEKGSTDFVGIARGQLADPEWVLKAQSGREDEIRKCISCLHCMESLAMKNHTECAINALSHHEYEYGELKVDGNGRKAVVIGAGPSGMEAARVLAMRGFNTVLFEKSAELGGQLRYAAKPPLKDKINWLIDYYKKQLELLKVDVRTGTEVTVNLLDAEKPDAVFLATGSLPIIPRSIKGYDRDMVYDVLDILSGKITLSGKNVVVVGSGATGLETAEMIAEQGNNVTVIEMMDKIGPGLFFQNLIDVTGRLREHNAKFMTSCKLVAIESDHIVVENLKECKEERINTDAVVLSLGVYADKTIHEEILKKYPNSVLIGDAASVGRIANAVHSAYKQASSFEV